MAGNFRAQEQAVVALTTAGAQLAAGSGAAAGLLDCRSGGNAADMFSALFSLTAQWGTVSGIAANNIVADLYLVPAIDGANFPDVDMTAGASNIPYTMNVGSFPAAKTPSANTSALFSSAPIDLMPVLYRVYIINRSGQTMSANWTLNVLAAAAQYT